jgi:A/G-specific adenine glycosylase
LKPLGLAWRVPAFQQVAKHVVGTEGGIIPLERIELLELPGVGDYVADAVLCFAKSEPVAIVDTNTVRIAGRYLGFEFGPESRRKQAVRSAVGLLIDPKAPRESNFALLDFAASICRAERPLCVTCPVASGCAWRTGVLGGNQPDSLTRSHRPPATRKQPQPPRRARLAPQRRQASRTP